MCSYNFFKNDKPGDYILMFADPIDDKWAEIATDAAKVLNEREKPYRIIRDGLYIALAMLYQALVKRGEIPDISSLPLEKRKEYWQMSERPIHQYYRVMICQAFYMYDLINGDNTESVR